MCSLCHLWIDDHGWNPLSSRSRPLWLQYSYSEVSPPGDEDPSLTHGCWLKREWAESTAWISAALWKTHKKTTLLLAEPLIWVLGMGYRFIKANQDVILPTDWTIDFWDNRKHFENCVEEGQSCTDKDRPAKGLSVFPDLRSSWLILDLSNMLQKQLQVSPMYLRAAKVAQSIIFRKKGPAPLIWLPVVFHPFDLNHFSKYKLLAKFVTVLELSKTSR